MQHRKFNILLIFPRFSGGSFWNYKETCEIVGGKHSAPPLGLITVAAMLPGDWPVRLLDHNVQEIGDDDLDWADIVMTGGMLPQQFDCLAINERAQAAGKIVVVGGPDATSSPDIYEKADFRVTGEAEGIMHELVKALQNGEKHGFLQAPKFQADVNMSPVPRFDLLNFNNYLQVGIQFSRGCPFTCEFCDIIELYGRKPRTKTPERLLAELDELYRLGYRGHVDLVDDNLIGNKKAVKGLLRELVKWQKQHGYPFEFSTEASLNLADDDGLLSLLREAGFFAVFIGIESSEEDVLLGASKKQNTKVDITSRIQKIYAAGIFVLAGFIVGFDDEKDQIAGSMINLIENAAIPVSMVGLLYALPNTQLTRRLKSEGRLYEGIEVDIQDGGSADQCTSGLNFETRRPRAKVLGDYRKIVSTIYQPDVYTDRVYRVARQLNLSGPSGVIYFSRLPKELKQFARLLLGITFRKPYFSWLFWKTLTRCFLANPRSIKPVLKMLALYLHLGPFANFVQHEIGLQIDHVEKTGRSHRELYKTA